ncbi:MAG: DNA polymerase [Eubacterium sp.]
MKTLAIDIETYSSISLKESGVYRYCEAPDFTILLFAYAYDDEPVQCLDLVNSTLTDELIFDLTNSEVIKTAFNANFERTCLSKYIGQAMEPEQWRCTMVKALTLGYPGSLEKVANAMNFPEDKQKQSIGKALIRYFSIPCKPTITNGNRTRNLPEHDLEKWQLFMEYCKQDVEVEREIRDKLSPFRTLKIEQSLWCLDQRISDYGVNVDLTLVDAAINVDTQLKDKSFKEIQKITSVSNPNSRAQLKAWVEDNIGYTLNCFDKGMLEELARKVQNEEVKNVIHLRQLTSKTSVRKYQRMRDYACDDGRARGFLQFYGANRTGRWSGRGIQLQNLPQNHMPDLDDARMVLRSNDLEFMEILYDNTPDVLSQLIRTAFIPSAGNRFIVSDFSAIEARVIAWLAGEHWRQDVFKTHGKIYEASASAMFNVPLESIHKGSDLRQRGKVAELACGFGGGTPAIRRMGGEKIQIPVDFEPDVIFEDRQEDYFKTIIDQWRKSSPKIVKFWWAVDKAAKKAVTEHTTVTLQYGLQFSCIQGKLFIRLPSKRKLCYVNPAILPNRKFGKPGLVYYGTNQETGKWGIVDTYGAKLVENIVQAVARDCLAVSMLRLENEGYQAVFHVHDEVVLDVPKGVGSVETIGELMGRPIDWATGLILRADGYECDYYLKD